MIKGINHIGLYVKSIDETLQFLKEAYSAEEVERHSFAKIGQISSLVRIGKDHFELMEPRGTGMVAKFLEEKGRGSIISRSSPTI